LDDTRKIDNRRHGWILHQNFRHPVSNIYRQNVPISASIFHFCKRSVNSIF
jgi:hypothetical protein